MLVIDKIIDKTNEQLSEQIFALYKQSYEFGSPWTIKQIENSLNDEKNYFLFLIEGELLIGLINYTYVLDQADIINLVIAPTHKRKGLAELLVTELKKILLSKQVKEFFLEVRQSNVSAQKFYEKMNFEKVTIRKNYYHNPLEDALILRGNLG
ncbi:MAG: ribosomal protein S18-alanine N-acetyltransferase [Streptococcaceae bacterium]|jgi:ribosomal-protein-alanine N-acetyltransferase|nr:ribosomal protein S18-alanine N-acetyltransferase [Streptococcaceae bacterium]